MLAFFSFFMSTFGRIHGDIQMSGRWRLTEVWGGQHEEGDQCSHDTAMIVGIVTRTRSFTGER